MRGRYDSGTPRRRRQAATGVSRSVQVHEHRSHLGSGTRGKGAGPGMTTRDRRSAIRPPLPVM
ncbi:hypothetical protein BC834DRAFT_687849 [Gloeopeniophorella convolvens]|nr:hypothetical protein BC834DRAFT_687849 [Gloeopeniophorella convolvens]